MRDDGYKPPTLIQLRLEKHVAIAAVKWWEVEDFVKNAVNAKIVSFPSEGLARLAVKLCEEK